MPKKKTIPADELQQAAGELPGQAETLPQDMSVPKGGAPFEGEPGGILTAGDSADLPGEGTGNTPEVLGADVRPIPQDDGVEGVPQEPVPPQRISLLMGKSMSQWKIPCPFRDLLLPTKRLPRPP